MSDENIEKQENIPEIIQPTVITDTSSEINRILAKPISGGISSTPKPTASVSNVSVNLKYWALIIINLLSVFWVMALRYYPNYQMNTMIDEFSVKVISDWVEKYSFPSLLTSTIVLILTVIFVKTSIGQTSTKDSSNVNPILGANLRGFISSLYFILPMLMLINWHIDRIRFGYSPLIISFIGMVIWVALIFANFVYLGKRTLASRNDFIIVANFAYFVVIINQLTFLGLCSWLIWKQFITFKII